MLNIETLRQYESQGKLKSQSHPIHNLIIWNYTQATQMNKDWDEITRQCRGLITDNKGKIVARSFPKFFNMEELTPDEISTHKNPRIFQKMDGSLGILFYYTSPTPTKSIHAPQSNWIFASRGSFCSPQSQKAIEILVAKYPNYTQLDPTCSYVFEVIYPENRIVVDYGADEKLVYLSTYLLDGSEKQELDEMRSLGFNVVAEHSVEEFAALKSKNIENEEGYVVRFDDGFRMKIKFDAYLSLHRTRTGLTPKMVYDWCKENKPLKETLEFVPDEFMESYTNLRNSILERYKTILNEAKESFTSFNIYETRGEFARAIQKHHNKALLFLLYESKPLRNAIFDRFMSVTDFAQVKLSAITRSLNTYISQNATVIVLIGISGSGKSTWVREYLKTHSKNLPLIVSRDSIRRDMFELQTNADLQAYYKSFLLNQNELLVNDIQDSLIKNGIAHKRTVIVDNTNLKQKYIKRIVELCDKNTQIVFKKFELPTVDEAFSRIQTREYNNCISRETLEVQTQNYLELPEEFVSESSYNEPCTLIPNPERDETGMRRRICIVVDMDGTLALNKSGRSPYDMTRVYEDTLNETVVRAIGNYTDKCYNLVICTGRTNVDNLTEKWLNENVSEDYEIYYRKTGDNRPDYIVKEEMWREIAKKYYIEVMFDDRNSVVKHARKLGFTVFQVADGNF